MTKREQALINEKVIAMVNKFSQDYGRGTFGCKERLTYREV